MIANNVIDSYSEMSKMKSKLKLVLEKDTDRFQDILANLNLLLENK